MALDESKAQSPSENETGGYDIAMFVDKKKAKNFTCAFCLQVMKEPTYIGCPNEHSYCKTCVDTIYEAIERTKNEEKVDVSEEYVCVVPRKVRNQCPRCFEEIKKENIEPDEDLYGEVLMLEINCLKCNNWQGKLANYKKHLRRECGKINNNQIGHGIVGKLGQQLNGMVITNANTFQIFVRTLEGRDIAFNNMSSNDTIEDLQQKIQDKEGIPVYQQRLVYHGRNVDTKRENGTKAVLGDYKIKDQSTINLVKRLKGGPRQ